MNKVGRSQLYTVLHLPFGRGEAGGPKFAAAMDGLVLISI